MCLARDRYVLTCVAEGGVSQKSYDTVQLQKKYGGGGHVLVKKEERWGNVLAVIERSPWVRQGLAGCVQRR